MESQLKRLQSIRHLALLLTALSALIVCVSAYIRLSGAGFGCVGWPGCYGEVLAGGPHPHVGVVRILHRATAALTLLLGFLVAWRCQRPAPIPRVAGQAAQLLVLMILLTFIGIFSSDAHRAWASFLNIVGGALLVTLAWRLTATASASAAAADSGPASAPLPHAGLALLLLAIMLGALIGARYAALACDSLPFCNGVAWPAAGGWIALNPFATVASAAVPGDPGGVALHLLHRYAALATVLVLGLASLRALGRSAARTTAAVVLALLLAQFALGVFNVLSGFTLWLTVAHGVGAAALLAAGAHLLVRIRSGGA